MGGEPHRLDAEAATHLVHRRLDRDADAGGARRLRQETRRFVAQVGDNLDLRTGLLEVESGAIGVVVGGSDGDALADLDAVLVEIAPRRVGQHHARPVVVGEDERPLDRARRQHDLARSHLPEPLARQIGIRHQLGLGQPLAQRQEILRVIAERLGARHQLDVGHRAERGKRLRQPVERAPAVDPRPRLGEERAAGRCVLVAEDDLGAARARRESRRQAGGTGADNQDVAMIEIADVAVGIGFARGGPEPGGKADRRLINVPPGPVLADQVWAHEGLVVEAGADERRRDIVDFADVVSERRPAVLARRHEAIVELDLGRAHVRGEAARAAREADERVRLFRSGGEDAARPMIFVRASDDTDAIG